MELRGAARRVLRARTLLDRRYLPAFAGIQASLDATPLEIQQRCLHTSSPSADVPLHGALPTASEPPVILVALAIYTIASIGAALAASAHALIACDRPGDSRWAPGMVVGRAMIRDLFGPEDAATPECRCDALLRARARVAR